MLIFIDYICGIMWLNMMSIDDFRYIIGGIPNSGSYPRFIQCVILSSFSEFSTSPWHHGLHGVFSNDVGSAKFWRLRSPKVEIQGSSFAVLNSWCNDIMARWTVYQHIVWNYHQLQQLRWTDVKVLEILLGPYRHFIQERNLAHCFKIAGDHG